MDQGKRYFRELKRKLKQKGSKRRRAHLKRNLAENPEGAIDTPFEFGRSASADYNGMDQDATRRREG